MKERSKKRKSIFSKTASRVNKKNIRSGRKLARGGTWL